MEQYNVLVGKNSFRSQVKITRIYCVCPVGFGCVCYNPITRLSILANFLLYIFILLHTFMILFFVHVPIIGEHGLNVLSGFVQGSFSIR